MERIGMNSAMLDETDDELFLWRASESGVWLTYPFPARDWKAAAGVPFVWLGKPEELVERSMFRRVC